MKNEMERRPVSSKGKYIGLSIMIGMIVISVVGSAFLVLNFQYIAELENQGLLGLFVISIFAGSPLPIPTPTMILTFTLGSILNPVFVGLVAGFGNGVGNGLVYLTGHGGFLFFKNLSFSSNSEEGRPSWINRVMTKLSMPKIRDLARRRAMLSVFLLSMYPNPFLLPIIIGMGATRYKFWKFFLAVWAGKTVESMVLSFLGYFGLRSLLRYIGIFQIP
jgi:membrane protein YqaA with SNARE-associated domain